MNTDVYRVLLVEDDVRQASLLLKLLSLESGYKFEIIHAASLEKAKSILGVDAIDVVVLDLNLSDSIGIITFRDLHAVKPEIPIVILSGNSDEDTVVQSLKNGAQDYLVKGQDNGRVISRTLQYAVQRKRAELEVRRLHSLVCQERRMESLGILAGGIAHEINTPTQFVSSNLEFISKAFVTMQEVLSRAETFFDVKTEGAVKQALEREIATALKEERYRYFMNELKQTITESMDGMDRIRNIVRSMKSFMRNGKREFVAYDVNRIISDAVNLSRNEWKYIAKLNLELAGNLPLCSCCPQELCQAFLNIIINAVHAIAVKNHGGGPTVERGDIGIHTCLAGENIEVRIADNGSGIPDEVKEHMFEPFFTTKETGDGTGLGLSLVYNIVNKHGGRIWYDSRLNQGTVFTVALPLNAVDPEHSINAA